MSFIRTRNFTLSWRPTGSKGAYTHIVIQFVWCRTRAKLKRAARLAVSGTRAQRTVERWFSKPDLIPYGLCVPFYSGKRLSKADELAWERRGARKFRVLVSGTGRSLLDTTIHELGHVARKAFPSSEEHGCTVLGLLAGHVLPWLAKERPGTRLTPLFVCDRLTKEVHNRKGTRR